MGYAFNAIAIPILWDTCWISKNYPTGLSVGYDRCIFYGRSYDFHLKTLADLFLGFKIMSQKCQKHILLCGCDLLLRYVSIDVFFKDFFILFP